MVKSFIGIAASAVLGVSAVPAAASASTVAAVAPTVAYSFDGTCDDCDGIGHGVLTLVNYAQGDPITADNFVSFTYASNLVQTSFGSADLSSISGDLSTVPGANTVDFFADAGADYFRFFSDAGGSWCLGTGLACTLDEGATHVWSLPAASGDVPEPLTWALLGAGFGLVGGQVRRARRPVVPA